MDEEITEEDDILQVVHWPSYKREAAGSVWSLLVKTWLALIQTKYILRRHARTRMPAHTQTHAHAGFVDVESHPVINKQAW